MPTRLAAGDVHLVVVKEEYLARLALQRIRHMPKWFGIRFDFADQMRSKMMRKSFVDYGITRNVRDRRRPPSMLSPIDPVDQPCRNSEFQNLGSGTVGPVSVVAAMSFFYEWAYYAVGRSFPRSLCTP